MNLTKPGKMHRPRAIMLSTTLLALLWASCGDGKGQGQKQGPNGPMQVRVKVLRPEPLSNTVQATGSLLANESVDVRSEVAGRIVSIGFQEGSTVKQGQELVRINDDDLQAQLRKAGLAVQLTQDDEARKKQLLAVNGISQQDYDDARIALQSAEADRDNLQAQIAKTSIRAPFSGKIGLRQVSMGGYVSPNTLITGLQQVSPMKIEFSVPERYGREIAAGKKVSFTLDGDTTSYEGVIYALDPAVDPTSRTITARARNPNADGRLRPGSFVRVNVALAQVDDALMIPTEALIPDIQGQMVLLIKGGKAVEARVQTGIRTSTDVQLVSGVQAGDTVITTGLLQLRAGMPVKTAPPEKGENNDSDSANTDGE